MSKRVSILGTTAFALLTWLLAGPAAAGQRQLHISLDLNFTGFTCLNDDCSLAQVTLGGGAHSNLNAGPGSYTSTLIVDFSPGGDCNIVDETDEFTFDAGTITVRSHHED